MIPYLHTLSAWLFYLLGGSFFAAYMVQVHTLHPWGAWWLQVADLPLALIGAIYGGTSLYVSVKPRDRDSKALMVTIGFPLALIVLTLVILNFWELIPQG